MIYFLLCLSHSIEKVLISFNQEKKNYLFRSLVSVGRFDLSAPSYLIPSEVELSFWSDNELLCSIEVLLNSTRTTSPDSVGEVWIQINPNFKLGIESICKCRHGMILVFGCRSLSLVHIWCYKSCEKITISNANWTWHESLIQIRSWLIVSSSVQVQAKNTAWNKNLH